MAYDITKFVIKALDLAVGQMEALRESFEKAISTLKLNEEKLLKAGEIIVEKDKEIVAGGDKIKEVSGEYSKLLRRIHKIKDKIFPIWSNWSSNKNVAMSEVLSTTLVDDLAGQYQSVVGDLDRAQRYLSQRKETIKEAKDKLRPFWSKLKLSEGYGDAALSVMIDHFVTYFTANGVSTPITIATFDEIDGVELLDRFKEKIRAFTHDAGIPTLDNDNIEYMLDQLISYTKAQDELCRGISGEIKAACGHGCGSSEPTFPVCPCVDFIAKRGPESPAQALDQHVRPGTSVAFPGVVDFDTSNKSEGEALSLPETVDHDPADSRLEIDRLRSGIRKAADLAINGSLQEYSATIRNMLADLLLNAREGE